MIVAFVGGAIAVSSLLALWWALSGEEPAPLAARNLTAGNLAAGAPARTGLTGSSAAAALRRALLARSGFDRAVSPALDRLNAWGRRVTPTGMTEALQRRILLAGAPEAWTLERTLAIKGALGMLGLGVGVLLVVTGGGVSGLVWGFVLAALGYFTPDVLLHGRADRRQTQIRLALPDTLDQMTIAVEAGLGFDAAMARAGRSGKGPMAEELVRTLQDVQAGMTRSEALRHLGARTKVAELRHFVLAVIQADGYGVPLAQVLRVQAAEMRVKRRQLAEEQAMKLQVKILFPLVLCIFPALFIVLLGPAVIQISRAL